MVSRGNFKYVSACGGINDETLSATTGGACRFRHGTAAAQRTAIPIPILNPGFEEDELFCSPGLCYQLGATGWIVGPQSGTFKPGTTQFPGGVPGGVNVGYADNVHSTGSFLQTLGALLRPNTTYTLTLSIGQRADLAMTVYTSGANPPEVRQALQILVKSVGTGQVDFDNLSLTATAQ
jgi:hypothetical protein